jgi:hypothetical protein
MKYKLNQKVRARFLNQLYEGIIIKCEQTTINNRELINYQIKTDTVTLVWVGEEGSGKYANIYAADNEDLKVTKSKKKSKE